MVKVIRNNFLLFLILVLALFLRTYKLDYLELFGDEVDAGYQAYSLLNTGRDYRGHFLPLYAQSFSEWRAPGLMYAMIPFIKIFGLNEWGVRLTAAFYGLLSLLFFYLVLGKIGVNTKLRLVSIFLLSINPWHIQYSRAGFELTLLSTLIFSGCYLLLEGINKKNSLLIFVSGIIFCLSFYTYNTANILVPLLILLTLIFGRAQWKQISFLFLVGTICVLPIGYQVVFGHASDRFGSLSIPNNKDVVAEIESYRNAGGNSLISKIFYNTVTLTTKHFLFNYGNSFSVDFLFKTGDVTFRHSLHQIGNLYWIELPLIILGMYFLILSKEKWKMWIFGLLLISPLASSLTIDGYNHASRLFMLVFPLSVIAALGFESLNKLVKFMFILIILFEFLNFQFYYWTFYKNESWRWWHTGYKQAMTYISENKNKYNKVIMDNTYEPALIRYLFWNKINPANIIKINDKSEDVIDGYKGFCTDSRTCFVNFGDRFNFSDLKPENLYLISQDKQVGGDWNLSKNTPEGIKILKTVTNPYEFPVFYLISVSSK